MSTGLIRCQLHKIVHCLAKACIKCPSLILNRETRKKDSIQRNEEDGTLTFKPISVFEFDRAASIGSELDQLYIFNAAFFVRNKLTKILFTSIIIN